MLPERSHRRGGDMATHGVRGDVIVQAPVVNPRPPTTAATGLVVVLELFTTVLVIPSNPLQYLEDKCCRQLTVLPKSSQPLLRHQLCPKLSNPCTLPLVHLPRVRDARVQLRACRWMSGQGLLDQSS